MSKLLALVVFLLPTTAFAHPGHGHTDPSTWGHYLTEPEHVIAFAGSVAVLAAGWFMYRRARSRLDSSDAERSRLRRRRLG